ncbi:hypothetical protein OAF27_02745, partial [Verrucomicrobiales bacterium]|nr:hypothetical protein [Verrucomicrobiales bacterium]
MTNAADHPAPPETAPRRSRARRWLRRFFIAFAILFLLSCVLATIGYFNRAKLLTLALKQVAAPNTLNAEATRFDGLEGISFDGVSVVAPGEKTPFAKADSVTAKFDIEGLQRFHLDSLAFSGLILDLPASMLKSTPPDGQPKKPSPTSSRTLSLGSLSLPDTKITAELPNGTTIFTNITFSGSDISFTGGSLYASDQRITITDAQATLPDGTSISLSDANSTIDFLPEPLLKNTTVSGTATLPQSADPLIFSIESPTLKPTDQTGTGTLKLSGSPVPGLNLEGLEANISWAAEGITLNDLQLTGGSFQYSFAPATPGTAIEPEEPRPPLPNIPPIHITSASTTLDLDLKNVPGCGDLTARSTIDLSDVTYSEGVASSPARQSVSVSDARIKLLDDIGTASAETASASVTLTPESTIPATLHELSITGGKFSSVASPTQGRPALKGNFVASSAAGKTSLQVIDVAASTPDPDAPAFASVGEITVTLDPTTCLDTRHIDSVMISGASTTISNPVLTYLKGTQTTPSSATDTAPDASLPAPGASWTLGEFAIARSSAILADILPGLPPLPFAINTTLHDVPLSRQGFIESEIPQKLTLSKVTLGSQLNPLVPVIQFGELSVDFTLGGL